MNKQGWYNNSYGHKLASMGITVKEKPKYSKKSIKNMTKAELANEVEKALLEVLWEFDMKQSGAMRKARDYFTDYDNYLEYLKEHGPYETSSSPYGKEETGAYAMFGVEPGMTEKEIKAALKQERAAWKVQESELPKVTEDLQILKDKVLVSEHNDNIGWTVNFKDKPKDSNVLLAITYDGGAYDYFSYEADYGGGMISKALDKKLKEKFGNNVIREDYTTWASQIYDQRGV